MRRLAFISALLPRAAAFAPTGGVAASVRYLRAGAIASAAPDVDRYYTKEREPETRDFIMQQTMLRVKDPAASLAFYCDVLGFNLVTHREFEQWGFNVYFVAPVDPASIPSDPEERFAFCMRTPGCIELTWNYGSEGETGPVYNVGNGDATGTKDGEAVRGGFGHLGITVLDVYDACARFAELGCEFTKTPNSGGIKGLAFFKDPDGYLIEVLPQGSLVTKPVDHAGVPVEGGGYVDNSKKK